MHGLIASVGLHHTWEDVLYAWAGRTAHRPGFVDEISILHPAEGQICDADDTLSLSTVWKYCILAILLIQYYEAKIFVLKDHYRKKNFNPEKLKVRICHIINDVDNM